MSVEIFLLGMQAAGNIMDFMGTEQEKRLGRMGTQVEQSQIQTRLEQERTSAAMASLDAMTQLRQTLATQRAVYAARGTDTSTGNAFFFGQQSLRNFNSDERIRRMNLLSREADLRAAGVLSGMHQLASETRMGQELSRRAFEQLPFSEAYEGLKRRGQVNKTKAASKAATSVFNAGRASFGIEEI